MKSRVRDIVKSGDRLFNSRPTLMDLWQELAMNFYPMRADFTMTRVPGQDFAEHLMTARPVLAHRDLSNALSSMLRPRSKEWFYARTGDDRLNEDTTNRTWLDQKSDQMRRIMYDPRAQFIKSTKQGDADFSLIGWCALQPELNRDASGLLYRAWHPRDIAFCENSDLQIDVLHRNWQIEARAYLKLFPNTAAREVEKAAKDDPYKQVKCRHVVLPADEYDLASYGTGKDKKKVNRERFPFVSIYVDAENDAILEEVPRKRLGYIVPRWVTLPGSQYPHSPATVTALADARMLQRISLTVLEAGERAIDPPLKATKGAVGAVNWFPGGVTWVDRDYDERNGPAVEALMDVHPNLQWGDRREEKIEHLIQEAFYLNKMSLPPPEVERDMTKWEAQQRVEEYIRNALPLFEPMEVEYNGALCEETWNLIMDVNGFGRMDDIPDGLKGQDIRWQFETPLREANERQKAQAFVQSGNILALAAGMAQDHDFNTPKAKRDALLGVGIQADWLLSLDQADASREAAAKAAQMAKLAGTVATGADVAGKVGAGLQQLQAAGVT